MEMNGEWSRRVILRGIDDWQSHEQGRQQRMQSYPLDLATILYLLQGQSGRLQAILEAVPGVREPCQATIMLLEGKIATCFLETRQGELVAQGERVLNLLTGLGTIDWLWEAGFGTTLLMPARNPTGALSPIPRRREPLRQDMLEACSRLQRRVLGLVDGRRTIQEIATLLAVPPTEFERLRAVLRELQTMGLLLIDE